MTTVDVDQLEAKVKDMYRLVAQQPQGRFHFELGRELAVRLGYDPARLVAVPAGAVDSFAGVGQFFDLAAPGAGETVVDLGSGAGMDAFYAAGLVRPGTSWASTSRLSSSRRHAGSPRRPAWPSSSSARGTSRRFRVADAAADYVISNGVINLCPDKATVFVEAARVLRPGGMLAIADIVTERPLTEAIVCNADLWASCIGGAPQEDAYLGWIEAAGFTVEKVRANPYAFLSAQARSASLTYGVKSISVLASKGT